MQAGDVSRTDERRPVLFLNTPTAPPLGADTWVHAEIMRRLDRTAWAPVAAHAFGPADDPTPTHRVLGAIPDLELVRANLGPELNTRSTLGKVQGLVETLPALWTVARLAVLIKRRGIEIIHTSDRPRDAFVAVVLGRLTGARSIVHVHVGYNPAWMGRLLRWSLAHADVLVAISEFVGQTLVDGGMDPARVRVVTNGIDVQRWHPDTDGAPARQRLGIGPDDPLLITICRLFPEKGPAAIIEAVARLRDELPGIQLLIVGSDVPGSTYSDDLRRLAADLGVSEHVRLLGRRDDIEELLAAADVFVMPSHEEPFGLVFCEAMAMGKPVVAVDDGGTVEIVEHGRTGLLSTYGDIDALTANLRALLLDPARRAEMGALGRRVVAERLTADTMAAAAGGVYQAIASRDPVCGDRASRGSSGMRVLEHTTDVETFRRALDEDGFIVIRDVVDRDRLSELAADLMAEYERFSVSSEMFEGGGTLSGHLNCFPGEQSRFVWDEISKAGIPDLVRAVRPDIADSVRATLNFNLPGSVPQHYHTDGLYTKEFLICNIAVVDTDLRNGAIDLLPGTNREFYKFWRYAAHRLWRKSTRVPMRQGDVMVRKSTQWHRGMPNYSDTPRPMMAITFGEMDDLDLDPFAMNDGKPFFYANWYRTNRLGKLREQVFVKAPISYSAWRFARSLYGNKGYSSF
jgi:glycosyltransferase involved in cell wall biosynthesis